MKQFIILLFVAIIAFACGNNTQQTPEAKPAQEIKSTETSSIPDTLRANPDYSTGLNLVAQSDCLTCHKIDDMSTGPSYRDVANKYGASKKNIPLLADKIIKGGNGVWGQIPMTPHANLSKKDAEQMVKYIFLLKNK